MRNKIWRYKSAGIDREKFYKFANENHLPYIIAMILYNRGITDGEAVRSFLQKPLGGVHDPYLLDDMEPAAQRIVRAIQNKEKIVVYGDYDVDGITSTVLLYSFLKSEGADAEYYIPDRIGEGYGINIMAINKIARSGAKLMITVDCGITAVGEVEFARTQKLDVIITDHHTCKEELPRALAVVNPKRSGSGYPFDSLAGVGVALKVVLAAAKMLGRSTKETFYKYAELAALGTIADLVPVLDENRIIIQRGLDIIKKGGNIGVRALLKVSGADKKPIDASTVAFTIAPRINAAGRIGSAETAVKLLLSQDMSEAEEIARELDKANNDRRMEEKRIYEEAVEKVMSDPLFDKKKVIVAAGEGWHHGVIGIVASRICERFYKPCILISYENGTGKGSGRSIPGFSLFDALTACEEYLTNFGGHAAAAGLGINMDRIEEFTAAINKYAESVLTENDMIPKISIDCSIKPSAATLECVHAISKLEPFGAENEKPVFSLLGAEIAAIDTMGADSRHLRLRFNAGGKLINAVGFNMGEYAAFFRCGDLADAAFTMESNVFRETESLQLMLKDIKRHSEITKV